MESVAIEKAAIVTCITTPNPANQLVSICIIPLANPAIFARIVVT